jgi:cell wall-associated NlpC family hydrolase
MRASMTHGICGNRQVCRPSQMCPVSAVVLVGGGGKFVTEPPVGVADTEFVSLGAVVQYVGEVLGRAHALFGDPADGGGGAASSAGGGLSGAGQVVRSNEARVSGLSGDFVSAYSGFTGKAAPGLDTLAGLDDRLGGTLSDAAGADRDGRSQSGAVVNGAQTDTAALAPWTGTAAGQKALLTQLRGRLASQQQVLAAYQARDARMAAMLRSMGYRARVGGGGGMPFSPAGLGGLGGGGGLGSVPGLSGLSGLASAPVTLASALHPAGAQGVRRGGARGDPRNVAPGPGGEAVAAALSRQGSPYVWGAKGPSRFDYSGLTQWAWRHAGVQLGNDTYSQINEGVPVAPGEVRPGDLIFPKDSFGEGARGGPGHVQLAISSTEVIHAPQTGDVVRVAPMPSAYVARRPVPAP